MTDSDTEIKFDKENIPGISNLLTIYSSLTDKTIDQLTEEYKDSSYGDFKKDLGEVVKEFLIGFQEKYNYYLNSEELDDILDAGRDKAARKADRMIEKMERAMGLGRKRKK
jgi:tryptophanyl-tRNA synthetase